MGMHAPEFEGWLRHIDLHGGDRHTHYLLATLICMVGAIGSKRPPNIYQVAPWLEPAQRRAEREKAQRQGPIMQFVSRFVQGAKE